VTGVQTCALPIYGEGVLRGLLVDLTEKGIKSYLFTSG
jgi:hypothetical protein